MKVVHFSEIRAEIISNIRRNMLIPVIGSGFTRGCTSRNGQTPSGEDYRQYMIDRILDVEPAVSREELEPESFSDISEIYHKYVSPSTQRTYLLDNFTQVELEENKKNFLSLPWPYIYTLNIDDAIENESIYKHIVLPNRTINQKIFDDEKCLIKLHGDIKEIVTYLGTNSEIMTQTQYVKSLRKNEALLSKLRHDGMFENLIFIGCSLDDEIDLMSSLMPDDIQENRVGRYICLTEKPAWITQTKYERYGITHCIIFDSYDEIYNQLYNVGNEANTISENELFEFRCNGAEFVSSDYEENEPYLLFGKNLINSKHVIELPYFFISRNISRDLMRNLSLKPLQLLIGSRASGKTYTLIDLSNKVRDRDVFFFSTKDRLSEQAFIKLMSQENCLIVIDDGVLTEDQFKNIVLGTDKLQQNSTNIVVAINKNDRELKSILDLYEAENRIDVHKIGKINLDNVLAKNELEELNKRLRATNAGIFEDNKSILDNIVGISKELVRKNKYTNIKPKFTTQKELAALIVLGTERKVYSFFATKLDLVPELEAQRRRIEPLMDYESTWSVEKSNGDNSPAKYVLNAEYWLYDQLQQYAQNRDNYPKIANAYYYIILKIIAHAEYTGQLNKGKNTAYKKYIFFDNINKLFSFDRYSGKQGLALIREIYEKLNDKLADDPNYMHQRAKCYLKSAYYETNNTTKLDFLKQAYRMVNVATQEFDRQYAKNQNEKIAISRDHTKYTQALILCYQCRVTNYENVELNTQTAEKLYEAFKSPANTYSFAKTDTLNYKRSMENFIFAMASEKTRINRNAYRQIEDLLSVIK